MGKRKNIIELIELREIVVKCKFIEVMDVMIFKIGRVLNVVTFI